MRAPVIGLVAVTQGGRTAGIYPERAVVFRPPSLIVGAGASRGVPAEAGLVTCFYNPASARRGWQRRGAIELLAGRRPPLVVVGSSRTRVPGDRMVTPTRRPVG
jgi:hypothetical protein